MTTPKTTDAAKEIADKIQRNLDRINPEWCMTFAEMQRRAHANSKGHGFWDHVLPLSEQVLSSQSLTDFKLSRITLMHEELSESVRGIRKALMDDKLPHRKMEEVELADCIIRIMDYAGGFNLDVAGALIEKMEFNKGRERLHGDKV